MSKLPQGNPRSIKPYGGANKRLYHLFKQILAAN